MGAKPTWRMKGMVTDDEDDDDDDDDDGCREDVSAGALM